MQIDWASNPNIRPACLPDAAAGDYDQWMSTVTGQDDDDYNADHYDDHVNTAYDCEDAADDETSTGRRMSNKRDFHQYFQTCRLGNNILRWIRQQCPPRG